MRTSKRWMGFDSLSGRLLAGDPASLRQMQGMVPPRTTITITNRPQLEWWRGERLYVHRPIASSFIIHDIRVGVRSTIAAVGPIPADAFATRMDRLGMIQDIFDREGVIVIQVGETGLDLLGAEWPLPRATTYTDVILTVENITEDPLRFLAGFIGDAPID